MQGGLRMRSFWWAAGALLLVAVIALGVDSLWLEPSSLQVVHHRLDMARKDARPLDGLRVAVVGDIHAGANYIDDNKIRKIVQLTNEQRPDLILLAGDYVSTGRFTVHREPFARIARLLGQMHAPLGVYAVIGNHDRWYGEKMITQALEGVGVTVLENDSVSLPVAGQVLLLVGVADDFTHAANPAWALRKARDGQTVLCLTHSPMVFRRLPHRCALTIAGHTHGGQVNLPLISRALLPEGFGFRYAAGSFHEDGKYLFVTPGIGTSGPPIRFRVSPEISVLEIHAHE